MVKSETKGITGTENQKQGKTVREKYRKVGEESRREENSRGEERSGDEDD